MLVTDSSRECVVLLCIEVHCVPGKDVAHVGHVHKALPQLLVQHGSTAQQYVYIMYGMNR